jgi:hypothetical protein
VVAMTFGDFSDLISFEDFTNISKWRHFATNKVSGYAFDILNECVAYERSKEELGTLQIRRRCCPLQDVLLFCLRKSSSSISNLLIQSL